MRIFQLSVILFLLSLSVAVPQADAQKSGFNVKNFLQRLDKNQNGKLEPGEIPDDRTKSFLEKAGVDTSKSVDIKGFSNKIKSQKQERREAKRAASSNRNMPGFEVGSDGDRSMGFEVADAERETTAPTSSSSFSDGTRKMADWVLDKYDKNKDGKIDAKEIKGARWQDPPVEDSDTNKDGTLSRVELLRRYQKREDKRGKKEANESKSRSRSRDSDRSSSSRRSRRRSDRSSSSSSKKGTPENRDNKNIRRGYEAYVKGIFKKFDKDNDGSLNKDEIEEMRRKPDKTADANKDGKVSQEELLNSYLIKAGQNTVGSTKGQTASSSSSRPRTSTTASGAQPREPLTDKDANKNGQIEMNEFAGDMSQKSIDEFYKKDKNGDGIITRSEWERE